MSQATIDMVLTQEETSLRFRAGDVLFREGEAARGVYVLQSGLVHLLFANKEGAMKALREAHPGQILGLSSVVTRRAHDCTAVAVAPCRAAFIAESEFLRLLDDSPAMWFSVLHVLSSDVNAVYDDMRALAAR